MEVKKKKKHHHPFQAIVTRQENDLKNTRPDLWNLTENTIEKYHWTSFQLSKGKYFQLVSWIRELSEVKLCAVQKLNWYGIMHLVRSQNFPKN